MSAFIGQIHYWLYEKIRLVSQREDYIYQKAVMMCGSTAEELREQVWQTYGEPLAGSDLSELIDHTNIHGWLQRQIHSAESREAAFVKELLATCGVAATDIVKEAFKDHGKICGETAKHKGKYDENSAPGIYQTINDVFLNGMPCDQGDRVIVSEFDHVQWEKDAWLQAQNWKRAGSDAELMIGFYQEWLTAFVTTLNPDFVFGAVITDQSVTEKPKRYEICKKQ